MLVLTRRLNQSVVIGNDIKITVLEIKKDGIRLGISAPKDVSVYRQEIYDEIQKENIASTMVDLESVEEMSRLLKPQEDTRKNE